MLITAFLIASIQSDMADLSRYRAQIVPSVAESRFEEIGWKATMWSAVLEAQRKDRPVLLWAMNGHPLACT